MQRQRLVFLDVDGTLRDMDGWIPESAVKAIRRARENGHRVYICSGRPFFQIGTDISEIGFDGIIASSGGYVTCGGTCIRHHTFEEKQFRELVRFIRQNDSIIEFHHYQGRYILADDVDRYRKLQAHIEQIYGGGGAALAEMPTIIQSDAEISGIEKMLYYSGSLKNDTVRKKWENLDVVALSIPNSERYGGEITPKNTTKAEGIAVVLKYCAASADQVIAIGDGENDLTMFEAADISVAMGNGMAIAKERADFVTRPLRENGIQKAFEMLGLIQAE